MFFLLSREGSFMVFASKPRRAGSVMHVGCHLACSPWPEACDRAAHSFLPTHAAWNRSGFEAGRVASCKWQRQTVICIVHGASSADNAATMSARDLVVYHTSSQTGFGMGPRTSLLSFTL